MRLNQVTVGAIDFAESVDFYSRLGLRLIVSAREEYARFELPDGEATMSIHLHAERSANGPTIYFEVADVEATVEKLKAQGFEFDTDPDEMPWKWTEARLTDPAGNELCIFHAGENRRYPPWRLETRREGC